MHAHIITCKHTTHTQTHTPGDVRSRTIFGNSKQPSCLTLRACDHRSPLLGNTTLPLSTMKVNFKCSHGRCHMSLQISFKRARGSKLCLTSRVMLRPRTNQGVLSQVSKVLLGFSHGVREGVGTEGPERWVTEGFLGVTAHDPGHGTDLDRLGKREKCR